MTFSRKQVTALIAVFGVFMALKLFLCFLPDTILARWQQGLHYNYVSHIVFIIIPFFALILLRRKPHEYGLTLSAARNELLIGIPIAICLFFIPFICELVFGDLRITKNDIVFIISTIVFQVIFVGFGEELLFRGFFQGELNRIFKRRFLFGHVHFGWGLIIASVLFGVGHLLNPFNPLQGRFALDIPALVETTTIGFSLGLIREYFGSLIVISLIHGMAMLFPHLFNETLPGKIGWFISCGFVFAYFVKVMLARPIHKETDLNGL